MYAACTDAFRENYSSIKLPWLNPGRQLSPIQPFAHLPPPGIIGRVEVRKPAGCDKDSLIDKAKLHAQVEQNKEFISFFHSQADVLPLPGKLGYIIPTGYLARQTP